MGIAVGIGDLALFLAEEELEQGEVDEFMEVWEQLDQFLQTHGLPGHNEPRELPEIPSRGALDGFPYSWTHFLRRAYAYLRAGKELDPFAGEHATADPVLKAEYDRGEYDSHLIHFSDTEGFYVPLDFPRPLVARAEGEVLGDIVGSSYGLLKELREVAPTIDIELTDGILGDQQAAVLADYKAQENHSFGIERLVWFAFFEAVSQSIRFKSAIRFG